MKRLRLGSVALVVPLLAGAFASAATPLSYTYAQAWQGRLTYYEHCAECHGGGLEGKFGPALAGGDDRTQFESPASVYAYVTASMPHGNPGALSRVEYVDVLAFLLQQHGKAAGTRPLTQSALEAATNAIGP